MDVTVDKRVYAPGSKILLKTWWVQVMEGALLLSADNKNLFFLSCEGGHSQHFTCMFATFLVSDMSPQEF